MEFGPRKLVQCGNKRKPTKKIFAVWIPHSKAIFVCLMLPISGFKMSGVIFVSVCVCARANVMIIGAISFLFSANKMTPQKWHIYLASPVKIEKKKEFQSNKSDFGYRWFKFFWQFFSSISSVAYTFFPVFLLLNLFQWQWKLKEIAHLYFTSCFKNVHMLSNAVC